MLLLTHATLFTAQPGAPLGADGAVAVTGDRIAWVGRTDEIPAAFQHLERHSCDHRLLTPGLIDCHTHVVHAGHRAAEFEARLEGATYAQIALNGGGILSTVRATRAADDTTLMAETLPRIAQMIASGTTTVEIKSGYGLDFTTEERMLRAARSVPDEARIAVVATHLAAHAVPPDYALRPDAYIDEIAIPSLRQAAALGLVDAVDAFCETIAFSLSQVERLFHAARKLDLPVKLHAEQLSDQGGAALAARYSALSADHLEYLSDQGIAAMSAAGTAAVILPGAFYSLRETQAPPIEKLRAAGVPMAVATDCNPGSSPMVSLPLAMNMACTLFRLTPTEALLGTTLHAARALGLADRGRIAPGLRADLCLWDAAHPAELSATIGATPLHRRMFQGSFDD
jgi:imidazolonepropionase